MEKMKKKQKNKQKLKKKKKKFKTERNLHSRKIFKNIKHFNYNKNKLKVFCNNKNDLECFQLIY